MAIYFFFGGAQAAARCDCECDVPRPTPIPIVPRDDKPTPVERLWLTREPPAQTICIFLVLPELQLGQLLILNAPN